MKKIIALALTLTMAFAVTACDKDDENTSSTSPTSTPAQVSSQETSEPEVSLPAESTPAEVSSDAEPEQKEWEASDFDVYGISDIEKPDFGTDPIYYTATQKSGIIAMWEGVTDMDKITDYGKSIFALTEAKGGNYNTVYNPEALKWQLNEKHASFDSACTAWTPEYYYSEWYYENNGILVNVAYYGEGETVTLKVYPYSKA